MVFSWSYVVIAWTLAIIRMIAGDRTLQEFEPDSDDFEEERGNRRRK